MKEAVRLVNYEGLALGAAMKAARENACRDALLAGAAARYAAVRMHAVHGAPPQLSAAATRDAEARRVPSGLHAIDQTASRWTWVPRGALRLALSQTWTVPSHEALTIRVPGGLRYRATRLTT